MFSRPEKFDAVSSQSIFDVLHVDCTDGEWSGEEESSGEERFSGDEGASIPRGEFERHYESDVSDHDDRPLIEFKTAVAETKASSGFCPILSNSRPTNSDPEAWRAYHANKFKGWPLEAKEELLRLRYDEFGQRFDVIGQWSPERIRLWSELVARFDQKFPEYKLSVLKAKTHLRDYKAKYRKGPSGRRCPHWDLYAKYFGSHCSADKNSSLLQKKNKPNYDNNELSTTKQRDQKSNEDRGANSTESLAFQIDSYIAKLRMKTFKTQFDYAPHGGRKILWDDVTASVNRQFYKQNLSSHSVRSRFSKIRGMFKNGGLSKDQQRILLDYFKDEDSVRRDVGSKVEGSKRIAGENFQNIETIKATDDQASARTENRCKRPRHSSVLSTSRQDALRAFSISTQKAADLVNDLLMF